MPPSKVATVWREDPALVRPMAASTTEVPPDQYLTNPALVFEPKFDGIRALVSLEPATGQPRVRLWSRNGNDKTSQFPEVVKGLREFALRLKAPVLLDGEIVALDARGEPGTFQQLQGRMHLKGDRDIAREANAQRAAFIAFDILRDGNEDLVEFDTSCFSGEYVTGVEPTYLADLEFARSDDAKAQRRQAG